MQVGDWCVTGGATRSADEQHSHNIWQAWVPIGVGTLVTGVV